MTETPTQYGRSKPLNILALDLATHTGWATLVDGRIESGVQSFELSREESKGMRFYRFNAWLAQMLNEPYGPPQVPILGHEWRNRFHLVAWEQCHHRGGPATQLAEGLTTRVMEQCAVRGIEHCSVHTGTLKKYMTGSGAASKADMIAAVERLTAVRCESDDEADALAVLFWAKRRYAQ